MIQAVNFIFFHWGGIVIVVCKKNLKLIMND